MNSLCWSAIIDILDNIGLITKILHENFSVESYESSVRSLKEMGLLMCESSCAKNVMSFFSN